MDFDLLLYCEELLINENNYIGDGLDDDLAVIDEYNTMQAHDDNNVSLISPISHSSSQLINDHIDIDEDDLITFGILLEKECEFHPGLNSYLPKLRANDDIINQMSAQLRCRSVHWLLKACETFGFCPLTAALSVNYLDRYLAQNLYSADSWKPWMFELLSVACLSIAAKMEEVDVPLLRDLQVGGLEYYFHDSTVQRMELAVMNSLGWKLRSITPIAFAEKAIDSLNYLTSNAKRLLSERVSELILGTLPGLEFLQFRASVIAVASIQCALDESFPIQATTHGGRDFLLKCIPANKREVEQCAGLLDELVVDPPVTSASMMLTTFQDFDGGKSPPSPTGVIIIQQPPPPPTELLVNQLGMDATWPGDGDAWAIMTPLMKKKKKKKEEEEEEEEEDHRHLRMRMMMPKRQRREE